MKKIVVLGDGEIARKTIEIIKRDKLSNIGSVVCHHSIV